MSLFHHPAGERHLKNNTFIRGGDSASTLINFGSACDACTSGKSDSLFHSLLQDLLIINASSQQASWGRGQPATR